MKRSSAKSASGQQKHRSLEEFVADTGGRFRTRICWICKIPERAQVDAARLAYEEARARTGESVPPISTNKIADWLRTECGYETATEHKVRAHFDRGHHRR